jgi:flagellar protein FliS
MLYRGAIQLSRLAAAAIERKDIAAAHEHLVRAQSIILTLRSGLRREMGPVTQSLDSVYEYLLRRLVEANVAKDGAAALEVASLLQGLLDSWREVLDNSTASKRLVMRPGGSLDSQQ